MEVEDKVQEEDDWIVDERVGGGGSCSVCREQECGTAVCREQLTKDRSLRQRLRGFSTAWTSTDNGSSFR